MENELPVSQYLLKRAGTEPRKAEEQLPNLLIGMLKTDRSWKRGKEESQESPTGKLEISTYSDPN